MVPMRARRLIGRCRIVGMPGNHATLPANLLAGRENGFGRQDLVPSSEFADLLYAVRQSHGFHGTQPQWACSAVGSFNSIDFSSLVGCPVGTGGRSCWNDAWLGHRCERR